MGILVGLVAGFIYLLHKYLFEGLLCGPPLFPHFHWRKQFEQCFAFIFEMVMNLSLSPSLQPQKQLAFLQ